MNAAENISPRAERFMRGLQSGRYVWYCMLVLPAVLAGAVLFAVFFAPEGELQPVLPQSQTVFRFVMGRSTPVQTVAPAPANQTKSSPSPANEAAGGGSATADELQNYLADVIRRVDRAKRYPRREAAARAQGIVVLRLALAPDGTIQQLSMLAPSAYDGLNREALAAVRRAAPFPQAPPTGNDTIRLQLRLRFVLSDAQR